MNPLESAGNYYLTRRHLSVDMRECNASGDREGTALCWTESNPVDVYDQTTHDRWTQRWERRNAKPIADLPLCKKCERKAAKRNAEVDS